MSELINNSIKRKELLKHMILELHKGTAPDEIQNRIAALMQKIPYGEVVQVEQELISEGLPEDEVLRLCDLHTKALEGNIDLEGAKPVPPGHPVDTFLKENEALLKVVADLNNLYDKILDDSQEIEIDKILLHLKSAFNNLMDVEKHYQRKENLLFPFLEKYGITGPPKVMWGKHDQTRDLLKKAISALNVEGAISRNELKVIVDIMLRPASDSVSDMTFKEEQILLPMCMDRLTDVEWYEIYMQTNEIGYCLYDPQVEWKPKDISDMPQFAQDSDSIQLPTGSFKAEELEAILNTLPVDLTFVDRNDKVSYFSQSKDRIFNRNRAILKRDVRMCHPPSSVHIVNQIVDDFKSGKESRASFWINLHGKFILIEYFALRNNKGEYLGTLEVSQDLTEARKLEGEQRLLNYNKS
ncbi:MAG: DUF438 domain-containing protein [Candidatus Kapabacteria bacterium]|nr:DUF438 domain-containing protein [Candidatus Kapabacteria bacterium]